MRAMEGAMRGKEKLEQAVGQALKTMNVPTRSEFKRAVARLEALEREVASLKAKPRLRRKPVARRKRAAPAPPA
jgi:polyhydroxyalkanoate synthesis regulator phasin